MKPKQTYLLISIASVALIAVLIIQLNWIVETAKIKETIFNEKATIVLAKTAEALSSDTLTCGKMEACLQEDNASELSAKLGKKEVRIIDSIFNHYMQLYNFHIDYSFKVIKPSQSISKSGNYIYPAAPSSYKKSLQEVVNENGLELKLIFPNKTQFILAEIGTLFLASVVLILVVLILFWRTITSLLKEKKIAELTTDFLNNMTHEFKTPLTNIALASKMLIKYSNSKQEDKIKHYSGIILGENEKLRLQVEHVLSIAALERGEIPMQKTELDFHQLINDALKCMSLQMEHKGVNLKLNLAAENFVVMGDKTHLINTMINLIDNALKYSKENAELSIQTANNYENFVCTITDNGVGIEKEYHKKVFDKFFRVPNGNLHNVKGFGLGLAYIKKIIEMHGGAIELESQKDKGTVFTIILLYV